MLITSNVIGVGVNVAVRINVLSVWAVWFRAVVASGTKGERETEAERIVAQEQERRGLRTTGGERVDRNNI